MLHYPSLELIANFYLVGTSYILYNLIGYKVFRVSIKEIGLGIIPIISKQKNDLRITWGPVGLLGNVGSKNYKNGFPRHVVLGIIVLSTLPFVALMGLIFVNESLLEVAIVTIKAAVFLEDAKAVIQVGQASPLSFLSLTYFMFFSVMSVLLLPKTPQMLLKHESKDWEAVYYGLHDHIAHYYFHFSYSSSLEYRSAATNSCYFWVDRSSDWVCSCWNIKKCRL